MAMEHRLTSAGISVFIPPRVFVVLLLAGVIIDFATHHLFAPFGAIPVGYRIFVGAVVVLASLGLMLWTSRLFRQRHTTIKTNISAGALITSGPFAFSRNPIYVGFVGVLFGLSILVNGLALLIAAIAMFLYLQLYVIPHEERYLAHAFGRRYLLYLEKVRRWL